MFFLPPPCVIHVEFGISQSPSYPYLAPNWGGSFGFLFQRRIDRNGEQGGRGKREQHRKTYRNENTEKRNMQKEWGKQQDQAIINLAKSDETWRVALKTSSSQRWKSTQIGVFFCRAYQVKNVWGGEQWHKSVPKLEFECFAHEPTKSFVPWDVDQNVVWRVSWQPTCTYGDVRVGERTALHCFCVCMQAPLPKWFCLERASPILLFNTLTFWARSCLRT